MTMARAKRRALLLAAGEVERRAVEIRRQLQKIRRLAHFPIDRRRIRTLDAHRRGDVLIDGQRRVVDELLIDHGDATILHAHAVTSLPSSQTEPDVGLSRPAISRISEVLPDSVGPSAAR